MYFDIEIYIYFLIAVFMFLCIAVFTYYHIDWFLYFCIYIFIFPIFSALLYCCINILLYLQLVILRSGGRDYMVEKVGRGSLRLTERLLYLPLNSTSAVSE